MRNKTTILSTILSLLLISCGNTDRSEPGTNEERSEIVRADSADTEDRIYLNLELSELEGVAAGDELEMSLDNGDSYTLIIQRAEETIPGMINIGALIEDMETGQATLIYRDGTLRGSVDMYAQGMSYQMNYDSAKGQHYIIQRIQDELEGGEPLTPETMDN